MAPTTRRTYAAGLRRFEQFTASYAIAPYPASTLTLKYFTSHLARTVTYQTIKVYLAAIRLKHIELGYPDPTTAPLLKYFVCGIKRIRGSQQRQRLPITIEVLRKLKLHLGNTPGYRYQDQRMLWAAFTTAFFGVLRASEFVCPSMSKFDPHTTLLWSDLTLGQSNLRIRIKRSKTDPFRQGHSLLMGASSSSVCPVLAMQKFRDVIGNPTPASPVFTFADGSFLTRERLTTILRQLLKNSRLRRCFICKPQLPAWSGDHSSSSRPPGMADSDPRPVGKRLTAIDATSTAQRRLCCLYLSS